MKIFLIQKNDGKSQSFFCMSLCINKYEVNSVIQCMTEATYLPNFPYDLFDIVILSVRLTNKIGLFFKYLLRLKMFSIIIVL